MRMHICMYAHALVCTFGKVVHHPVEQDFSGRRHYHPTESRQQAGEGGGP